MALELLTARAQRNASNFEEVLQKKRASTSAPGPSDGSDAQPNAQIELAPWRRTAEDILAPKPKPKPSPTCAAGLLAPMSTPSVQVSGASGGADDPICEFPDDLATEFDMATVSCASGSTARFGVMRGSPLKLKRKLDEHLMELNTLAPTPPSNHLRVPLVEAAHDNFPADLEAFYRTPRKRQPRADAMGSGQAAMYGHSAEHGMDGERPHAIEESEDGTPTGCDAEGNATTHALETTTQMTTTAAVPLGPRSSLAQRFGDSHAAPSPS